MNLAIALTLAAGCATLIYVAGYMLGYEKAKKEFQQYLQRKYNEKNPVKRNLRLVRDWPGPSKDS